MTLALVKWVHVDPSLFAQAERIADDVADATSPRWGCAFHHAIDLLYYARGWRTTTRCLLSYSPNDTEARVELILEKHGVVRGMRESNGRLH